jgi:hypothetical protein
MNYTVLFCAVAHEFNITRKNGTVGTRLKTDTNSSTEEIHKSKNQRGYHKNCKNKENNAYK